MAGLDSFSEILMLLAQVEEINCRPVAFKAIHVSKLDLNYTKWYDALGWRLKGNPSCEKRRGRVFFWFVFFAAKKGEDDHLIGGKVLHQTL